MLGAYYSLNGQREGPESKNLMALEGQALSIVATVLVTQEVDCVD